MDRIGFASRSDRGSGYRGDERCHADYELSCLRKSNIAPPADCTANKGQEPRRQTCAVTLQRSVKFEKAAFTAAAYEAVRADEGRTLCIRQQLPALPCAALLLQAPY
jgi:hypothetical protein